MGQTGLNGLGTKIVVVDNELEPNNHDIVRRFPGCLYIHEPHRGVANARNAELQAAFANTSDWLAFIDDDEVADPLWLSKLLSRAVQSKADVVGGPVRLYYPKDFPPYLERREWRTAPETTIGAGNMLVSMRFLRGLNITPSFDPRFTAGEDGAFLALLHSHGAVFAHAADAIVTEEAVVSRLGFWGSIRRGYNGGKRRAKERGRRAAVGGALRLVAGPLKVVLSPLAILAGPRAFGTILGAGLRTTASGAGVMAGLLGAEPVFYLDIDGY